MGLLTPLYLAGLAAISLPLLFHLIRRTPRGRQAFSTLMFLSAAPPRLTRRSRLDQLLLLLLRGVVLSLLAFAFARPFLRESAALHFDALPKRRVAVLVDTSASMRRGDLWRQAVLKVEAVLSDLGPNDDVALFTFDDRLRSVVDFEVEPGVDAAGKVDLVRNRLSRLAPTWGGSDLGAALSAVAGGLDAIDDVRQSAAEARLVLVSDLEHGCRTEALQAFEWPQRVSVVAHVVSPSLSTNAAAWLLVDEESSELESPRIRVTNAADSTGDEFFLAWSHGDRTRPDGNRADQAGLAAALATQVPAGQSRVVRLPRPAVDVHADRIVLGGDEAEFDNVYYVVPPRPRHIALAYLGAKAADDPQGLLYYLQLVVADDPLRKIDLETVTGNEAQLLADKRPQLVVVADVVDEPVRQALRRYAEAGGTLLLVPEGDEAAQSVAALLGDVETPGTEPAEASDGTSYLMLGEIDFTHPLFAASAHPRYSDFTKVRFWKHRRLLLKPEAVTRALARFDNGDPAILEQSIGAGRVFVLASGWHPTDSQLALSSKFVPLMQGIVELAGGDEMRVADTVVGQPVVLPRNPGSSAAVVFKPDGARVELPPDTRVFDQTDRPGLYRVQSGDDEFQFAVNLAASESDTAPLGLEALTQLGVRFERAQTRAERTQRLRQQRDTELESRQKAWRWLIVAALGVLIVETAVAGRAARRIRQVSF